LWNKKAKPFQPLGFVPNILRRQCRLIWCTPPGQIIGVSSADFDDGARPANGRIGWTADLQRSLRKGRGPLFSRSSRRPEYRGGHRRSGEEGACSAGFPEQHGKLPWPAHRAFRPCDFAGRVELEIRNTLEPFLDRDGHFHARKI